MLLAKSTEGGQGRMALCGADSLACTVGGPPRRRRAQGRESAHSRSPPGSRRTGSICSRISGGRYGYIWPYVAPGLRCFCNATGMGQPLGADASRVAAEAGTALTVLRPVSDLHRASADPEPVVQLMQPPLRPSQGTRQSTQFNTGSIGAMQDSTSTASSNMDRWVTAHATPAAYEVRRARPGSRRLFWGSTSPALSRLPPSGTAPRNGNSYSSLRPGSQPATAWTAEVRGVPAATAAGAAVSASASTASHVRPGGTTSGAIVSLGSLGPLILPPHPSSKSSSSSKSTARRRERAGDITEEAEVMTGVAVEQASGVSLSPWGGNAVEGAALAGAIRVRPSSSVRRPSAAANARGPSQGGVMDSVVRDPFGPGLREGHSGRPQWRHGIGFGGSSNCTGGGGDFFYQISRCNSWRELQCLQLENSGRLLPQHIPGLMAAVAKLRRGTPAAFRHDPYTAAGCDSQLCVNQGESFPDHDAPLRGPPSQGQDSGHSHEPSSAQQPEPQSWQRQKQEDEEQEFKQQLQYMWELAGSVLRLARSRELGGRSLATALWAVAKLTTATRTNSTEARSMMNEPFSTTTTTSGSSALTTGNFQPRHGQVGGWNLQQQQQQQQWSRPSLPRREDWQLWAREMARCCCGSSSNTGSSIVGENCSDADRALGSLWAGFSPQDVSQTLWAVATLECAPLPQGFLSGLLSTAKPRLATFGPQALSNTFWALSRLRCQPPPDWLDAACIAAAPQLPDFNPQALANTVAALAHLEHTPSPEWCEVFFAACAQRFWPYEAPQPPARVIATGVSVASSNRHTGSTAPQHSGVDVAPQSLVQTAWAVARLQLAPPAGWLDGLALAAARSAHRFNGQDVSNILWALGALRYQYPRERDLGLEVEVEMEPVEGILEARSSTARHQEEGQELELRLGRQTEDSRPRRKEGQELAAAQGPRLAPLLVAWRRCLDSMQPQQLSACLVASVHLGLNLDLDLNPVSNPMRAAASSRQGSSMLFEVVNRTMQALGRRLGSASGQTVANSLWAVARLCCRPSSGWMAAAVERFMQCLEDDDGGPQELANVWWALGRLRWAPPADAAAELLSRSLALAGSGDLRSGELAAVLWAVGRLGLRLPKPMIDRLVHILRSSLYEESQQQQQYQQDVTSGRQLPPARWSAPRHMTPAPPATLVTLLRALVARQATSQRSTVSALLERSLRHWTAARREPTAGLELVRGVDSRDVDFKVSLQRHPPVAAAAAGAAAARQVALALHSVASLGVSLAAGPSAEAGGRPGGGSNRGLAGAVVEGLRAVLPYANSRDMAMSLAAVSAMEAAVPMGLLAAALQRAGELYSGVGGNLVATRAGTANAASYGAPDELLSCRRPERRVQPGRTEKGGYGGDADVETLVQGKGVELEVMMDGKGVHGVADLATVMCSLGKLLELHAQRRAEMAAHKEEQRRRWSPRRNGSGSGPVRGIDGGPRNSRVESSDEDASMEDSNQEVDVVAVKAAAAAAAHEARASWDKLLRTRPRLTAARTTLLEVTLAQLEHSASVSTVAAAVPTNPGAAATASSWMMSSTAVQQLTLGLSLLRLAPEVEHLRPLARALVRNAGELPSDLLSACLCHLAAMGADMDPRVAMVLVGRLQAVHLVAAAAGRGPRRGWMAPSCGGVSCMVALWVLRRAHKNQGTQGYGAAARVLRTASPHNRAGRSRLRAAAERIDPQIMARIREALLRLREDGECRRLM